MSEGVGPPVGRFISYVFGDSEFIRQVGVPFIEQVQPGFTAAGFANADSPDEVSTAFPLAPPLPLMKVPIAAGGSELMLAVGLYVGYKFTDIAVDVLFTDLYERQVKERLSQFWKNVVRPRKRGPVVRLDHWCNDPGVLVRVEFFSSRVETEPALDAALEAIRRARWLVLENGLTHRVIAFKVVDGRIDGDPRLSEPL